MIKRIFHFYDKAESFHCGWHGTLAEKMVTMETSVRKIQMYRETSHRKKQTSRVRESVDRR